MHIDCHSGMLLTRTALAGPVQRTTERREKKKGRGRGFRGKRENKENILALHTSLRQSVLQLVAKVYLVTIRGLPSCQRLKRPTVDNHVAGRGRGDEKNRDTWKRRVGMW